MEGADGPGLVGKVLLKSLQSTVLPAACIVLRFNYDKEFRMVHLSFKKGKLKLRRRKIWHLSKTKGSQFFGRKDDHMRYP